MLKIRVLPTLLYKDFGLVKGIAFDSWRRIGSALQSIKVYNMRNVDELVFLDITATNEGRGPDFYLVDDLADECFMPLTVGGGVHSLEDVDGLLRAGADKVAINSAALENPDLIADAAGRFGSQSIVVSIDTRRHGAGYEVFTHSGTKGTGMDPVEVAQRSQELGAGEILITSIEQDGTMSGYDLELIARVTQAVDIPVIASGGAGSYEDLAQGVLESGASAVAASSMFQFTQQTPSEARKHLATRGIPVRR